MGQRWEQGERESERERHREKRGVEERGETNSNEFQRSQVRKKAEPNTDLSDVEGIILTT